MAEREGRLWLNDATVSERRLATAVTELPTLNSALPLGRSEERVESSDHRAPGMASRRGGITVALASRGGGGER